MIMRFFAAAVVFYAFLSFAVSASVAGGIQPENLRCEHLAGPLGIDSLQPRLSWILRATPADQRGQLRPPTRSSWPAAEKTLAAGQGDLWDSAKWRPESCAEIVYAGRPLESYQWCYWKVRVWDNRGTASDWTEPARWSMGILDPKHWQGKWLGYTKPFAARSPRTAPPDNTAWMQKAPAPCSARFSTFASRSHGRRPSICGLGYYELRLNGRKVGDRVLDPKFTRYDKRVPCTPAMTFTANWPRARTPSASCSATAFTIRIAKDAWEFANAPWSDEPTLLVQIRLDYADGTSETIASDATWRASTGAVVHDGVRHGEDYDARREMPGWDTAAFDDSAWAEPRIAVGPKGVLRAEMTPPIRVIETIAARRLDRAEARCVCL